MINCTISDHSDKKLTEFIFSVKSFVGEVSRKEVTRAIHIHKIGAKNGKVHIIF